MPITLARVQSVLWGLIRSEQGSRYDSYHLMPDKGFVHEAQAMLHELKTLEVQPMREGLPPEYWVHLDQALSTGDTRLLNEWAAEHYHKWVLPRRFEDRIIGTVLRILGHRRWSPREELSSAVQQAYYWERQREIERQTIAIEHIASSTFLTRPRDTE